MNALDDCERSARSIGSTGRKSELIKAFISRRINKPQPSAVSVVPPEFSNASSAKTKTVRKINRIVSSTSMSSMSTSRREIGMDMIERGMEGDGSVGGRPDMKSSNSVGGPRIARDVLGREERYAGGIDNFCGGSGTDRLPTHHVQRREYGSHDGRGGGCGEQRQQRRRGTAARYQARIRQNGSLGPGRGSNGRGHNSKVASEFGIPNNISTKRYPSSPKTHHSRSMIEMPTDNTARPIPSSKTNRKVSSSVSGSVHSQQFIKDSNSGDSHPKQRRRSSISGTRSTAPLASGFSSRRRSTIGGGGDTQASRSSLHRKTTHRDTSQSQSQSSQSNSRRKQHQPMQHDGGILCIKHLPEVREHNDQVESRTECHRMRFLSGGADGTIKLWEAIDDEESTIQPTLIRTYTGHKGYVHAIAILGKYPDENKSGDYNSLTSSYKLTSSLNSDQESVQSLSDSFKEKNSKQKKFGKLFVSASRDNTLRVWELIDDPCETDEQSNNPDSRSTKAKSSQKLRGHDCQFRTDLPGGVLCVCAVPSADWIVSNYTSVNEEGTTTFNSSGANGGDEYQSYSQFVSGGADGVLRVWDVRSAMNLDKVPKSGMYSTVQVQTIEQQAANNHDNRVNMKYPGGAAALNGNGAPSITALVCTGGPNKLSSSGYKRIGLFAGDAAGVIRRYSSIDECSAGRFNQAIWWGCTGIFEGHTQGVTSLASVSLSLQQHRGDDTDDNNNDSSSALGDAATGMLISGSPDGSVRVWDAFDARILKAAKESDRDNGTKIDRRMFKREALLEIDLNEDNANDEDEPGQSGERSLRERDDVSGSVSRSSRSSRAEKPASTSYSKHIGVTCVATLAGGRILVASGTDGAIRLWDIVSGLYQGSYNLGGSVQIWSLAALDKKNVPSLRPNRTGQARGYSDDGRLKDQSKKTVGVIVSGDNRGRLRMLRKTTSLESLSNEAHFKGHDGGTSKNVFTNINKTTPIDENRTSSTRVKPKDPLQVSVIVSTCADDDDDDESLGMGTFAGNNAQRHSEANNEVLTRNGDIDLLDSTWYTAAALTEHDDASQQMTQSSATQEEKMGKMRRNASMPSLAESSEEYDGYRGRGRHSRGRDGKSASYIVEEPSHDSR